jgi:hypothetical protein
VEDEREFLPELREKERERGRVGAAGDGEHEWTGAQERVGARVSADGAEDRGRRCV